MRRRYFPTAAALGMSFTLVLGAAGLGNVLIPATASAHLVTTAPPEIPVVTSIATKPTIPKPTSLRVNGRGYGHGRGLGQWGAYGYATQLGWSYRQILEHFYGGTAAGGISPQSAIGVRLSAMDNKVLIVQHAKGRLYTAIGGQGNFTPPPVVQAAGATPSSVLAERQAAVATPEITAPPVGASAPIPVEAAGVPLFTGAKAAIKVELVTGGIVVSDGPGCAGPWTPRPIVVTGSLTVSPGPPDPAAAANDPNELLQICIGKTRRAYRGDLLTTDGKPGQRTVNLVPVDAYLRSVVPAEISPSWAKAGIEAVKAQAVAARSYAAAEKRTGFANTCDTISCQVYRGAGEFTVAGGAEKFTAFEDPRTDRAVAETANEIRIKPKTGAPVRTEFSASTGGHTAGGDFPAVTDDGDVVAANPNRTWGVTLTAAQLGAGAKLGEFVSGEVTLRDGFGDDGGRVKTVVLKFTKGSLKLSGIEFMSKYKLKSSWFSFGSSTAASTPDTTIAGGGAPDTTPPGANGGQGGTVSAKEVVTEVGGPAATLAPIAVGKVPPSVPAKKTKKALKVKATVPPKPLPTILIAVQVGADPIRTLDSTGDVFGVPTTAPKPAAKAPTKTTKKSTTKTKAKAVKKNKRALLKAPPQIASKQKPRRR
jgi:SpoIID/LytB domain protein